MWAVVSLLLLFCKHGRRSSCGWYGRSLGRLSPDRVPPVPTTCLLGSRNDATGLKQIEDRLQTGFGQMTEHKTNQAKHASDQALRAREMRTSIEAQTALMTRMLDTLVTIEIRLTEIRDEARGTLVIQHLPPSST